MQRSPRDHFSWFSTLASSQEAQALETSTGAGETVQPAVPHKLSISEAENIIDSFACCTFRKSPAR